MEVHPSYKITDTEWNNLPYTKRKIIFIKYLPEVPFSENKTRRVSKLGYARGGHGFGEGGRGRGRERGRCHGRTG